MQECEKILEQIMREKEGAQNQLLDMDIWDWSQGVALYGIWKYYEQTGEQQPLDWLERWFEKQKGIGHRETINTMAPYLTLLLLYETTGRADYLEDCRKAAKWLLEELPRTELGGFTHLTMDSENRQQLWADTVFMAVLFLARLGFVCGEERCRQEAQRQFLLHIAYLSDRSSGLWYHGWSFERMDNFAEARWARGNCWFTIAAAEALDFLPEGWVREWIEGAWKQQARSLLRLQDGLWHTLLDHPDSYLEVSGSCGILYGLMKGVRKGYLPAACAPALEEGAKMAFSHIGEDGIVTGVSYGTVVAENLEYYKKVRLIPTGYGQNLMLLLLVEAKNWEKERLWK